MVVSRILKKLITDVNLAVAVEAVQAAGNLARESQRGRGWSDGTNDQFRREPSMYAKAEREGESNKKDSEKEREDKKSKEVDRKKDWKEADSNKEKKKKDLGIGTGDGVIKR